VETTTKEFGGILFVAVINGGWKDKHWVSVEIWSDNSNPRPTRVPTSAHYTFRKMREDSRIDPAELPTLQHVCGTLRRLQVLGIKHYPLYLSEWEEWKRWRNVKFPDKPLDIVILPPVKKVD